MNTPQNLGEWLGSSATGIVGTIISTVVIYLVFLLVTRIMGQRMLASLTTFDTLMALLFGGLIARTTLGPSPTLSVGITAFITLVLLHFTLGKFANTSVGDAALNSDPCVLMAGKQMLEGNMRRTNTTRRELLSALRTAGISRFDDVAAVIMEPSGKLSIYRRDGTHPIDRAMLEGVVDQEKIPRELVK